MKQLKSLLTQLLLISSLLLPWAATEAAPGFFEKAGHISKVGYDTFTVGGQDFRLARDAKLNSNDSSRRSFRDFKKGDSIYFKGKILNGVYYVDTIFYEIPEPS